MMFRKAACSLLIVASSVLAQKVMPGTIASTVNPAEFDAASSSSSDQPQPMSPRERVQWIVRSTLGPESDAAGLFSAGWGTLFNSPKEYGTHWDGFGERYGMRLTGIAVSNAMEGGLGAIWHEDARYRRDPEAPLLQRIGHAAKWTFVAQDRDGKVMPAYARLIAIPGSNFLSNTWRPDSDASLNRAAVRTGLGFLGRFGSNTFEEFWPDVSQKLLHRNHKQ